LQHEESGMQRAIVVKGRMVGPTTVELEEPVSEVTGDVEVVLRTVAEDRASQGETVFEFLRRLPLLGRSLMRLVGK